MRVSDKYVFFWQGFIGNWFKSPIIEVIDEYPYHFLNVEQYFMYMKARTFGDEDKTMKDCSDLRQNVPMHLKTNGLMLSILDLCVRID